MKYKNFDEWWKEYIKNANQLLTNNDLRNTLLKAWNAAVKQCTEIAKGHKCQLGRSDHEDQQDMTATTIMREIEDIK